MAQQASMNIERRLLTYISKKYPKSLKEHFPPKQYETKLMQFRRENEKKLIPVLAQLPNWGIGRIVTTSEWANDSVPTFWRITRVHVDYNVEEFDLGIAWGVFSEAGRSRMYEEEIAEANDYYWRLVPKYEEHLYTEYKPDSKPIKEVPLYVSPPPLLARMMKAQQNEQNNKMKDPMVRILIHRGPNNVERQRLEDGSLV